MNCEVFITHKAERQLKAAADWYAEQDPEVADRWYAGFRQAILDLGDNPHRCGLAHERAAFPFERRELLYGSGRRKTHRALFTIRPDRVVVYAVRHSAQRDLTVDDL